MSSDLEQIEEIRAQVKATQQYLRVICSMQLPFESFLSMERKALGQGRRLLNQIDALNLTAPGEVALTQEERRQLDPAPEPVEDTPVPAFEEPEREIPKPKTKSRPALEVEDISGLQLEDYLSPNDETPVMAPERIEAPSQPPAPEVIDSEDEVETPRPAPPRRSPKLVSKVKAKKIVKAEAEGEPETTTGAMGAIARAKAKAEEAKAKQRVTKVKLGAPSVPRNDSEIAPSPVARKKASASNVKRVKLGSGTRAQSIDESSGSRYPGVRRVAQKHRSRSVGGLGREDVRLRDSAASLIRAQSEADNDESQEDLTIAIGDASDYDPSLDVGAHSGPFSLTVELAEEEEEYEEEEEGDIPYLEPIGRSQSSRELEVESVEPQPTRRVRERISEDVLQGMFEAAHQHLVDGDLRTAVQGLTDLIDLEENFLLAYVARGRIYLDLGDYARAMSDFTIANEASPELPEPQLAIGDLYFSRKDYGRAIQYFNGALVSMPDNAMAYCRRGISHYYERNYERALTDLARALELNEDIPNIKTYISMAKKKSGR